MAITPFVTPSSNEEGVALSPNISAIFPFAAEEGTLDRTNCFLIQKVSTLSSNATEIVDVRLVVERVNLNDDLPFSGKDYGDTVNAKKLYRSKLTIIPVAPLNPNAEYSVLLSKDISAITVFDVKADNSNTGTVLPLAMGPYSGLIADTFTLEITTSGDHTSAVYKITKSSNNQITNNLKSKKRFVELDQGISVKFPAGNYNAGDKFTFKVAPRDNTNEIFSWDFKTGSSTYVKPADERSDSVVNLPTNDPAPVSIVGEFKLLKVTPQDGSTLIYEGQKGSVDFSHIRIKTKRRTSAFNGKIVRFIPGTPGVSQSGNITTINFIEGETLASEIIALINAGNFGLTAETLESDGLLVSDLIGKPIDNGKEGGKMVFKFSKPIDPNSVNMDKIKIIGESLATAPFGTLDFEFEVVDKELIIYFL